MNTIESREKKTKRKESDRFKGYSSFGEMLVEEAKKEIEEEKRRGVIYFDDCAAFDKKIEMDF